MVASIPNPNENSVPFDSGYLKVSEIHNLYYEQHGNKDGKPVIFLHGGPGGRASVNANLVFFDLSVFRVVLMDQRGAGKSLPLAELKENTSQLLVQDIETMRTYLSISKWHIVFGGSWGSTISILYAQTHPEVISSLVLRGIFLVTEEEIRWLYDSGPTSRHSIDSIFPDVKERWLQYLIDMKEDTSDPINSYYRLLTHSDPDIVKTAAQEWARPEISTVALDVPLAKIEEELADTDFILPFSKIEVSYFKNRAWLKEGQLLEQANIDKMKHIPTSIVQGRYDVVCPARAAWKLYQALGGEKGNCELFWTIAGHDRFEPENAKKTIEICKRYGEMEFE